MKLFSRVKPENIVYIVLWTILFIAPVVSIEFHHTDGGVSGFPWQELQEIWWQFLILFVAFLLHNFLLAPLLVYKRRYLHYFSAIIVLVGCFVMVQCVRRPDRGPTPREQVELRPHAHPFDVEGEVPGERGLRPPMPPDAHPPVIFGQQDVIATIWLVLMLGMNVGVKLFFRRQEDESRMADLERKNLEQQLEFLRYQINPHFLMNTLNNIHALVDIDPEEAKDTIVGFSKILRFVLYEGSKQMVPLDRELGFLQNYIDLMALRVADQVDLVVKMPAQTPDAQVPPLLFITFVENAFKHGVSYQQHSFIDIRFCVDDRRLVFTCSNSKMAQDGMKPAGGVGLQNVRRRLDLIYGNRYQLDISEDETTYNVNLQIPLS